MSLEYLIMKYIDGELTLEEDNLLRTYLKKDPLAKDLFDEYLEIHLNLKDDAETIVLPNSIAEKTQNIVMMKILNETNNYINQENTRKVGFYKYSKVAAVYFIIFLSFLFKISDNSLDNLFLNSSSNNTISKDYQDSPKKSAILKKNDEKKLVNVFNKKISNNFNQKDEKIVSNLFYSINNNLISNENLVSKDIDVNFLSSINQLNIENKSNQTFDNLINLDLNNTIVNESTNFGNFNNSFLNDNYIDLNFINSKTSIGLNTNIAYDFSRNGINTFENSSIKNISQSISYSIDNDKRFGIEFGMTEFSYPSIKFVKLNNKIDKEQSSKIEILDPTYDDGMLIIPVNIEELEKNYWGSVFYEQTFLNLDQLKFDYRIGIGKSNDGFVTNFRFLTKYNIISIINITGGLELRAFEYDLKLINKKGFATNISLIWGINFQF